MPIGFAEIDITKNPGEKLGMVIKVIILLVLILFVTYFLLFMLASYYDINSKHAVCAKNLTKCYLILQYGIRLNFGIFYGK